MTDAEPDHPLGSADPWETTVVRDLALGRSVGEYVIRRRIGSGGMGIVYEAEHPAIHRRVAIKLLRPEKTGGNRDLLDEARAAAQIRHRHIIDVYGFGELPGLGQYLVMDYLEGNGLDAEIRARAPLPPSEVISILDDTAAALSAAHAKGVIHRDLKPGNLFLVRESNGQRYVKVLDFGLAKATSNVETADERRQTADGTTMGTPDYIAPEQARGRAVDGRTDLYALGVIAFEMATGRVPFTAPSAFEVAVAHVKQPPPSLREFEPSVPIELETLVLKLLAKAPDQRPASAEALRAELTRVSQLISQGKTQRAAVPVDRLSPRAGTVSAENAAHPHTDTLLELPSVEGPSARRWPLLVGVGLICAVAAVTATIALGPRAPQTPPGVVETPRPAPPEPVAAPPEPAPPATAIPDEAPPEPIGDEPAALPVSPRPVHRPAPAKPGRLSVVTRGCTMQVTVDGQAKGNTPLLPLTLPAGSHKVKLTNAYCKPSPVERTVVLRAGEESNIELQFEKLQ